MRLFHFPYSIPGQWVTGITILSLVLAPSACNSLSPQSLAPGAVIPGLGVILNSNPANNVLGGVRTDQGDVFVYGTLRDDGNIAEIQGIVLRNSKGEEANIKLVLGRPAHAQAFDGSTVDVTYDEVSSERLKGHVDVFLAARNDRQTIPFDLDYRAAASQLADIVKKYLNIDISRDPPPSAPPQNIRVINLDDPLGAKAEARSSFVAAFAALYISAFAFTGFVIVLVMAQIMQFVIDFYVALLTAAVVTSLTLVFGPFIIMGNILRSAFQLPAFQIDLSLEIPGFNVPRQPQ